MRISIAAAAFCLSLLPFTGYSADTPPATSPAASAPAAGSQAAPPAAKSPATGSPAAASGDAAARHAKRTACLKDAKTKKLLGADKTAFVKNCTAAP